MHHRMRFIFQSPVDVSLSGHATFRNVRVKRRFGPLYRIRIERPKSFLRRIRPINLRR